MYKEFGIIIQTDTFEEGDIICHLKNWNAGIHFFGRASSNDVENYSGNNGIYLKLIQTSIAQEETEEKQCSYCDEIEKVKKHNQEYDAARKELIIEL